MRIQWLFGVFIFLSCLPSQARVYRYVEVGDYQASYQLADYKGQSFLSLMKEVLYPALITEAIPRFQGSHLDGVKSGQGVELRLTPTVSTYHVKYEPHWQENAERFGRSFAGVDYKPWNDKTEYVADASYKHYLSSLEEYLQTSNQIEDFYRAILRVLINCDPSGIEALSIKGQQVAGDFVAVYVAEQYRHLISGQGEKLGRRHNWDNAHLQVTLLAAFHAGQAANNQAMFYKGRFLSQVYHQKSQESCVYHKPWEDIPENHWYRKMNLTDYWQFNDECDRSGVNITRRDFQKMGRVATFYMIKNNQDLDPRALNRAFRRQWTRNFIETISNSIINNHAPDRYDNWNELVEMAVQWIVAAQAMAPEITENLGPESLSP